MGDAHPDPSTQASQGGRWAGTWAAGETLGSLARALSAPDGGRTDVPIVSWLGLPGPRSAHRQTGSARPWAECLASPPAVRQKAGGEVEADRGQEAESPSTGLSDLLHLDSDPRASPTGQRVFLSGANSPEQQTLLGSPREADRPQNAWWTVTKLHLLAPKPPAPSQEETWSRAVRCPCGHTVGRSTARTATRGDRTRRRRRRGVPGWAFPSTACGLSPTPASARTGQPRLAAGFLLARAPCAVPSQRLSAPGRGQALSYEDKDRVEGFSPHPKPPQGPGAMLWGPVSGVPHYPGWPVWLVRHLGVA